MEQTLKVGIAGLGTVGAGTVALLERKRHLLRRRTGYDIQVTAVSARERSKDRGIDLSNIRWHDDARDLVKDDAVDLVVELIGGSEGIAFDVCRSALERGKPLVTANKALLAHHGRMLAGLAEEKGLHLGYEAAVAGGIPSSNRCAKDLRAMPSCVSRVSSTAPAITS